MRNVPNFSKAVLSRVSNVLSFKGGILINNSASKGKLAPFSVL